MTVLEIGAAALVVSVVFYYLAIFVKTRAVLAFIGTCIVTGGLFGHILTRAAIDVSDLTNSLVGKIFGAAIPGLLVIVLAIFFMHDLHPKKGASKRTYFIGIALAACLVAGVSSFQTLNNLPANVRGNVGTVTTIRG